MRSKSLRKRRTPLRAALRLCGVSALPVAALLLAFPPLCLGGGKKNANLRIVDPLSPADFPTIQSAIDAAAPHDTVVIQDKGTPYVEDVIVSGKEDLTIRGDRGVVLQPGGGPPGDGVFRVTGSRGIRVSRLEISCDDRDTQRGFVVQDAVDVVLEDVNAEFCAAGVYVAAPATATMIKSAFFYKDAIGVDIAGGNGAYIDRTKTSFCGRGVRNAGDNTRIMSLGASDSETDGVTCVGGRNLVVERGSFVGNQGAGVTFGDNCRSGTVRGTTIDCLSREQQPKVPAPPIPPGFGGVYVRTSGVFTIVGNTAMNCTGDCFSLQENVRSPLTSPGGGYVGFNQALNCSDAGFLVELSFDGWVLEGNSALGNGVGFQVNSSRNVLFRNYAVGNAAGFIVDSILSERRNTINPADNVGIDNHSLDDIALPLDLQ
jgi:hypothetical protein